MAHVLVRSCYPLHARSKMLQHLRSCESPKMKHRLNLKNQEHVALQYAQVVLQALPLYQGCLQSPGFTRAARVRPSQQTITGLFFDEVHAPPAFDFVSEGAAPLYDEPGEYFPTCCHPNSPSLTIWNFLWAAEAMSREYSAVDPWIAD